MKQLGQCFIVVSLLPYMQAFFPHSLQQRHVLPAWFFDKTRRRLCRSNTPRQQATTSTYLSISTRTLPSLLSSSLALQSPPVRAVLVLVLSSSVGCVMEHKYNAGILGALLTASCLSPLAPAMSPWYDTCWTLFLPSSLALLLLGTRSQNGSRQQQEGEDDAWPTIQRLAEPFACACVASIIGGLVGYWVTQQWFIHARLAASCLVASYIGGSVNLGATARALAVPTSVTSAIAAMDLVLLASFFMVSVEVLRRIQDVSVDDGDRDDEIRTVPDTPQTVQSPVNRTIRERVESMATVGALALVLATACSKVEKFIHQSTSIPGTACAWLSLVCPLLPVPDSWTSAASHMSTFFFLTVFAAMGLSLDWAASWQSGLACLVLSTTALLVHVAIMAVVGWFRRNRYETVDLLIASHAAIGGPSTAASLAARIPGKGSVLTLAATVWGVVGYAIGTTIGIFFSRLLIHL